MKRILLLAALALATASILFWAAAGAHRGWTQTSVAVKTLDEVTGLEGIHYENRFVPGLDFLGAALAGIGLLAGASLFVSRNKPHQSENKTL